MAYLFHRSMSGLRGGYNPTNKCDTDLWKYHNVKGNSFHHFCCKIMEVTKDEYQNVMKNGSTLHFKRAMKPKKVLGGMVEPCDLYLKLKKTLQITGW